MSSQTKKYHAFISHSSHDKEVAEKLARDLEAGGYTVWFDSWEILVGHNIVHEVYRGITQSQFMVVLLSKASVQSTWVIEEFTSARTSEIEEQEVVILPAIIDDCEIPPSLKGKRYADFAKDWDFGLEEITRAIDGHRKGETNRPIVRLTETAGSAATLNDLDDWRTDLLPEMIQAGFVEGQAFKDVLIGPIDGNRYEIDKPSLKPLLDDSRVRLADWGGLDFPFQKFLNTQEIYLQTGLRYVDPQLVLYGPETFHFWQIDSHLNFLQRSPIGEDFIQVGPNDPPLFGTLLRSWTLADIVCPLIFAKNIIGKIPELDRIGVKFIWSGLKGRNLITLPSNRFGLTSNYQCQVPEWINECDVTSRTNISEEALQAAKELFWLFGWVPNSGTLEKDLEIMASGHFSA